MATRTKSRSFREEEDDHDRIHQSKSPDVMLAGDGSLSEMDSEAATTQDFTFEVAWEVVNKGTGLRISCMIADPNLTGVYAFL